MSDDERRLLSKVTPALLRQGGLQDLEAAALERALAADPDNAHALWRLAEVHRRRGDFDAARGLYRRVRGPDRRKAAWLHAVLSGDGAPEAAPGGVFWPAPFVWVKNFLAPGECDRLLALGVARHEGFTPAKVTTSYEDGGPSSIVDSETSVSLDADLRTTKEARLRIAPKIRSVLPAVLARLGMAGLDRYKSIQIVVYMRVYLTGGFFRAHRDIGYGALSPELSFVYFFHRRPRRFSGGDLLLYDTDVDGDACDSGAFSRITPLRNSIVFFPSACWHQATPVQCGTDGFEDGRWVSIGYVRRVDEDSTPERNPA